MCKGFWFDRKPHAEAYEKSFADNYPELDKKYARDKWVIVDTRRMSDPAEDMSLRSHLGTNVRNMDCAVKQPLFKDYFDRLSKTVIKKVNDAVRDKGMMLRC